MDYCKIGSRIRKIRKAKELSQENLAEMTDISVTHMCHIETGNTKMSLPVLVKISEALEVSIDYLLFENSIDKNQLSYEITEAMASCTPKQKKIILDVIKAMATSFDVNK